MLMLLAAARVDTRNDGEESEREFVIIYIATRKSFSTQIDSVHVITIKQF